VNAPAIVWLSTDMPEHERKHGNNTKRTDGKIERLPSVAHVGVPSSAIVTDGSGGVAFAPATLPKRDVDGALVRHPDTWFTMVIHANGSRVSYVLTSGRGDLPVRPLHLAPIGGYQQDRMQKALAKGYLFVECGCLQRQLRQRELGVVTVLPSRIRAKELLDGREPCEGECRCFEIEAAARREHHNELERQRAEEYRAANPQNKTDDAIALLATTVAKLAEDAVKKAKR
jgi:hypothetical protein